MAIPDNQNQPRVFDAVIGGQVPPPVESVVLGGLEGVKHRLKSPVVESRVAAVSEALKYGEAGLDLVIAALSDESKRVRRSAYRLLRLRIESKVQQALREYKPWNLNERVRINGYPTEHVTTFANRRVEEFNPITGITDPVGTAYAIRSRNIHRYNQQEYSTDKLSSLLFDSQATKLEALVIGLWDGNIVDQLVAAKDRLKSLNAIFIGDILSSECEISSIHESNISPILTAYPHLEVLQVRCGSGLCFSPLQHKYLEALLIETDGLSSSTISQICALDLPELEHLELWLGEKNYGGDSSVEDLTPILFDGVFSNLTYLGLRNSQYSDEIAHAMVESPLIHTIRVLDLSMGTLSDKGAEVLLNSPPVQKLQILNLSGSYLSSEKTALLYFQHYLQEEHGDNLAVQVISDRQKHYDISDPRIAIALLVSNANFQFFRHRKP
jgi:hypothetical protein